MRLLLTHTVSLVLYIVFDNHKIRSIQKENPQDFTHIGLQQSAIQQETLCLAINTE